MDDPSRAAYGKLEAALAAMPRHIGVTPAAVLINTFWMGILRDEWLEMQGDQR